MNNEQENDARVLTSLDKYIEQCQTTLSNARYAIFQGKYEEARESIRNLEAMLSGAYPLINEAEGKPAYPKPDIFSPED